MLKAVFRKFKDLRILSSATNSDFKGEINRMELSGMSYGLVSNNNVSLFTTINLLDDFDNAYPLAVLDASCFEIIEQNDDQSKSVAKILSVTPVDEETKMRIILAIDCSTSMNKNNKIYLAKEASKALVDSLLSLKLNIDIEIAVFPFSSLNVEGFINFGNKRIWSRSVEELSKAIDSITAKGDTPLRDALNLGLTVIEKFEGYKQIICLSDGADNMSGIDFDQIYDRARRSNTPIYTVGYGQDEYLQFLVNISELTGAGGKNIGSFMKISPENLKGVFSYLSSTINHAYHIRWEPTNYLRGRERFFNMNVTYKTESSGDVHIAFVNLRYKMI